MIEITSKGKDKYLYPAEINILQNMLKNNIHLKEVNNKLFYILKTGNKTATVKISKISKMFFIFKKYKTLTIVKIKYS